MSGMEDALFMAMVGALVKEREAAGTEVVGEAYEAEETMTSLQKRGHQHQHHLSLVAADPAAFYTDSAFVTQPHVRPPNPICSLGARCVRSAATITCHSCDNIEGGCSRYCQNCFNAYHPWYRSTHRWSRLGDVQGVTNELLGHVHRADIERNIADLQGLLKITSVWQRGLDTQNLDTKGDDLIKEAARDASRIRVKIRALADMACEDRTKVSAVAVGAVIHDAARYQRMYDLSEDSDGEGISAARE